MDGHIFIIISKSGTIPYYNCNNTLWWTPLRFYYVVENKKGVGWTLGITYHGCLSTRKGSPRCNQMFLVKKPPVDSSDIIPYFEWARVVWLGDTVKEEQYMAKGFPDWTNIQFCVRPSQHPASLSPKVFPKVALRILQVLLSSDWR